MPKSHHQPKKSGLKNFLNTFGPGLITGAADDDPSGIATYTQTGAQFGYGQLWTAVFMLPFMTAVQEASARIGAVNGKGIAAVVKQYYPKKILYAVVVLILIANTINIGADIGAMAAATQLLVPMPFAVLTLLFTFLILALEIFTSYKVYKKILMWLAFALLAYPLTVLIVSHPWQQVLYATFVPHIELNYQFFFIITGVFGTTISPYMFFWQASEEVEEEREEHLLKSHAKPHLSKGFLHNMRIDNFFGMFLSELATWSIILVAATVLHNHGITEIRTAADAAKAIEPLVSTFPQAGLLSKSIFAVGIIGLGLLSIPVLSGSAAYALAEAFNWREGLNQKLNRAHGFYGVITLSTMLGLIINFVGINPVEALVFTAVINGLVAIPMIFLIARIAGSQKIMGKYKSGVVSNLIVWTAFVAMGLTGIGLLFTLISKLI
jgi:NRAMP (natural resistance-associated macrophage protein)-like metal ion transporter